MATIMLWCRCRGTLAVRGGVPVPAPDRDPTRALRIDGLMRPFTKPQVRTSL